LQNGAYGLSADDACTRTARETGPFVFQKTIEPRALSLTGFFGGAPRRSRSRRVLSRRQAANAR